MKNIFKLVNCMAFLLLLIVGCNKKDGLSSYANGNAVVLTSSTNTIAASVADSSKKALTLNWTSPKYATDTTTYKYVVQIDSSSNFTNPATFTVKGSLIDTFTAIQLNNIALNNFGLAFNKSNNIYFRVISSYANNNEQYTSNVITIKITPYLVPPKVTPPASGKLFITGSATAGGWQKGDGTLSGGVPIPAQQFTKIDSVTYQGTFYLNGGGQYLLLPVNSNWDHKYNIANASANGISAGGSFGYDQSDNIPAPTKTGTYKIVVDFQRGVFTVTPVKIYGLLYVPGDYQGWTPASAPTLGSPNADGNYDGYVNVPAGGTYEFKLSTTPDFSGALGDGGNGTLSASGGNLKFPGAGYYHIVANTVTKTWSVTATKWGVIGSFTASNWGANTDVPMTYNSSSNTLTATITTVAGDQFKFRSNNDWGLNYGESGGTGSLSAGGDNIGDPIKNFSVPAGTHLITLFLNNSGYYTYIIQ